jgi:hypothetical protein
VYKIDIVHHYVNQEDTVVDIYTYYSKNLYVFVTVYED